MTALDLAILLGTSWRDVSMPDAGCLNGQRKRQWEFRTVVRLELLPLSINAGWKIGAPIG